VAERQNFHLESSDLTIPSADREDDETLRAIDEALNDAETGRSVAAKEVRKRLSKWITTSSTRKGR
jgi:predicted transcriptional regulator